MGSQVALILDFHYSPANRLTLTLPWVKARTGSSMAVRQTLSLLPRNNKGKGRQREITRKLDVFEHYACRIERRWHIPKKSPFSLLAIGLLVYNSWIQLKIDDGPMSELTL